MDITSKHANESLLHRVVTEQNPHVVGMMGIHIMDVLAGELDHAQFSELLMNAEHEALGTFSNSGGKVEQPQEQQQISTNGSAAQ